MSQVLDDPAAREEYLAKNLQALVIGQERNQGDFQTAIDTITAANLQLKDLEVIWNPIVNELIEVGDLSTKGDGRRRKATEGAWSFSTKAKKIEHVIIRGRAILNGRIRPQHQESRFPPDSWTKILNVA
ncbi:MAG: hypothetical protein ACJAVK_000972 [Akkermansiaceae bacterium]|jgi:hypothetical protein